ncbi:MAG TPA: GAF domain-containing sensor histidine kinase [Anaerolineae bacterium]|nr:GAF domain-containing sensor histidine kinase [Anaerolineae bacterium]
MPGSEEAQTQFAAIPADTHPLQRQLEKQQSQMAALHAVSLRVSRSLDLDKVMQQAVEEVVRVLEVEAAAISVIEAQTGDLVIRAQRGLHAFAQTPVRLPRGKGLAWETLQTQQPLIMGSLEDEPRLATPEFRQEHVNASILVPMLTGGEPVGVLSAMSRHPRQFDPEEVRLLGSIADHVAVALKNAALHEEMRRQSCERAFLFDLAAAIAPRQSLESLARESLQRTLDFLGWSVGVFLVEDAASGALTSQASVGDEETLRNLINPLRETALLSPPLSPLLIRRAATPPYTVAQIALQTHGRLLGWLLLATPDNVEVSLQTQEVLTTESNYLGIAVENVQLYQETVGREKSARALYQITRAMTGHDLPEMLKQILEELHDGVPYEVSGIQLNGMQHMKVMRLRVALTPAQFEQLQTHWRSSLNALALAASSTAEETQIIIRGQEAGALPSNALLSYLEAPVLHEGTPMGAILLARQQPFQARDQRLLFIIAYQLSKVLATIQLFQHTQEQARQLEETNALLKAQETSEAELFNDVAQELRTPVMFIQSYAELLLEDALGTLTPAQEETLHHLQEQSRQLTALVRDLGAMKGIAPHNLRRQPTDLAALLAEVVRAAQSRASANQHTLIFDCVPGPLMLWVDPERIVQVANIFLDNAIRFTPPGGAITFSLGNQARHIRAAVTDGGPAVGGEIPALLFKRLHQSQVERKYPGLGVSLILARLIVAAHNGIIGLEPFSGKGNTFYFLLPK